MTLNLFQELSRSLPTEENKKEMLDAIENRLVDKNPSDIALYALAIYHDDPFEA